MKRFFLYPAKGKKKVGRKGKEKERENKKGHSIRIWERMP
jgi:hypothetical protein